MNKIEVDYGKYNSIDTSKICTSILELASRSKAVKRIDYFFLSDKELLEVNRVHLNHDYYTDIITFDYSTEKYLRGEIYLSIDRIKDNAEESFLEELIRVMSHGVLHMLGYKDKTKEDTKMMRSMEDSWIEFIVSRGA